MVISHDQPLNTDEQDLTLTTAFCQAWRDWINDWQQVNLDVSQEEIPGHVGMVRDRAVNAARRLWRKTYANMGEISVNKAQATVYAFVALLDETLIFSSWVGQELWQEKPLEQQLYGTLVAGQRIPLLIKHLIRNGSANNKDLAGVYLQCLLLGFQGCLRGDRGRAAHEKIRRGLFILNKGYEASDASFVKHLERSEGKPVVRLKVKRPLSDAVRVCLLMVLMTAIVVACGHWFWLDILQRLEPILTVMNIGRLL